MKKKLKKISYFIALTMMLSVMGNTVPVLASENNLVDLELEAKETDYSGEEACEEQVVASGYGNETGEIFELDYTDTYEESVEDEIDTVAAASGMCGDNVSWSYADGVLTLSGTGATYDFASYGENDILKFPGWRDYRSSITSIVVESGVTSLGLNIFSYCSNATTVYLPETVVTLGEAMFYSCSKIESITIPSKVTVIPEGCFYGCSGIQTMDLSNVVEVKDYAFQNCAIPEIIFPKTATKISNTAFFNCRTQNFVVETGNSVYSSVDGVLYTDNGKTLYAYPVGREDVSFSVPSGVTTVGAYAFSTAYNLESISFANSVTHLGEGAFSRSGLTSITIPDNITSVDSFTFYSCYSLISVSFGKGLEETAYEMFDECRSIKSIFFGSTLKTLGARTFSNCYNALTNVVLPANVTKIGNGCFGNCYALESFTSYGLDHIPYQAFLNCKKLTSVNLNDGVKDIYRCTFLGCYALSEVTLPKSVTFVHTDAFEETTEIKGMSDDVSPYGSHGYRIQNSVNITGLRDYTQAYQVLELVNAQRANAGLSAISMDKELLEDAMRRAAECSLLFSHTRPDSSSCFTINEALTRENIAAGQISADDVMNSWMNSSGHKGNILAEDVNSIGIGCFIHNGRTYWVQCFSGQTATAISKPANYTITEEISFAVDTFSEASTSYGVIFGSSSEYTFTYDIIPENSIIKPGTSQHFVFRINNPGFKGAYAIPEDSDIKWSSNKTSIATVDSYGNVSGVSSGAVTITGSLDFSSASVLVDVTNNPNGISSDDFNINGIYWNQAVTDAVSLAVDVSNNSNLDLEYSWYACVNDNWVLISDWTLNNPYAHWVPEAPGDYVVVCKVRISGDSVIKEVSSAAGYHPQIKGICQMPYDGPGGGYLIGFESYDNNNYTYEMLILDCTLLAEGKDAWVYTTGQCYVPDKCFWTIWQPQYGYYWTLFRIYDENGTLLDERCYGFENIC